MGVNRGRWEVPRLIHGRIFGGEKKAPYDAAMDAYYELLRAIYKKNTNDYKQALKKLKRDPNNRKALLSKYICERFFIENPYNTELDGEKIIELIKEQIKEI